MKTRHLFTKKTGMTKGYSYSFKESNRFLMVFLSIYLNVVPERSDRVISYCNLRGIFITIMCFVLSACCFTLSYSNIESINKTVVNLFFCANTFTCFIKSFNLVAFPGKYTKIIEYFEENLSYVHLKDEIITMIICESTKRSNKWSKLIFIQNSIICTIMIIFSLISTYALNHRYLPIVGNFQLIDNYLCEFVFFSCACLCASTIAFYYDSLFISSSNFLTTQMDILTHEISNIKFTTDLNIELFRMNLSRLIYRHVHIIEACSLTSSTFSRILFVQLFVSTACMCFAMLHIQNVVILSIVPGQLVQISMYCYFGQKLQDKSFELAKAIYTTPWVDMDISEMRSILIALRQAQRPLLLKAGPVRTLDYDCLKNVFQASYSFYTVLNEFEA